ncbi:hypothetical protein SAMN05421505_10897 [Sinosporangium album]|uniref:Amidotransferase n=1 Tax=Sinosporangium album TaxID=504805 RepID=A0A1G7X9U3_9ACTN|nr:hypothetical protein [Sinosporangium album]SDG80928.1 hypothetical protein SAMN05421505_10897 [Sinosporangium album]
MPSNYLAVGMMFVGLFFVGGVVSALRQGHGKLVPVILGVLAALAITAGVLWW